MPNCSIKFPSTSDKFKVDCGLRKGDVGGDEFITFRLIGAEDYDEQRGLTACPNDRP